MRKRIAIAGHSEEGLSLIPLLETNPEIEVCAILCEDRNAALETLGHVAPELAQRLGEKVTADANALLRTPGLTAIIEAEPEPTLREALSEALDRGIQVVSPLIAKLLYAFGPVDATRKPDLLHTLAEILESYNLTVDRHALLNRVLQIAVGATGADRGSLMLLDPRDGTLRVDVAIGIERELIPKIHVAPGEGIAGRAFADRRALLLAGKADREHYQISRERDDVESAISVPLIYEGNVLGVLNLSHARERGVFTEEDLQFVEQLARIDAKIIARAEEYHTLMRDSARLRAQTEVREIFGETESLDQRLSRVCRHIAEELSDALCHVYLYDADLGVLRLQASSTRIDPLASPVRLRIGEGLCGWVARKRKPLQICQRVGTVHVCMAVRPLQTGNELIGVLSFEASREGPLPEMLAEKVAALSEALAEELSDALRDLRIEREAIKASAITEFATRLSGATDAAELYRTVTSSAAMILEAEHAVLRLQDPDSGRYQIRSYFGSADTDAQTQLFALEKELSIEAIKQRTPLRVVDLERRPELGPARTDVRSALVQTLRRDGRIYGTLSVLGKVITEPLLGESFSPSDQTVLMRFAEHVSQAIERVSERERIRHRLRFDDLTGLPNATHLRERLEQEIARCSGRDRTLALIRVQIAGLAQALADQHGAEVDRLILSIAQELRAALREFDVLARTAPDSFHALIPEPEAPVPALLGPLARRARGAIQREPDALLGESPELVFGYALFPDDGQTAKALLDRALEPRITSE
ncbi:MAG: GAF domain-containing protein [Myxococcota bacterium]